MGTLLPNELLTRGMGQEVTDVEQDECGRGRLIRGAGAFMFFLRLGLFQEHRGHLISLLLWSGGSCQLALVFSSRRVSIQLGLESRSGQNLVPNDAHVYS